MRQLLLRPRPQNRPEILKKVVKTRHIIVKIAPKDQGVSVRPFLALLRAQRSSDFYPERTPHARVWFIVILGAHRTHTCNFL